MGPMKEDSKKILDENQSKDEELVLFDVDDDDDEEVTEFDVSLLSDLEDVLDKSLSNFHQGKYKLLSEAEVRGYQEHEIKKISDILSVSRAEASILLLHFNWNLNAVPEAWFTKEQELREELGLLEFPVVRAESSDATDLTCGICLGLFPPDLTAAALCGHIFCTNCWAGVIRASLVDAPACLMLKCPDPSCSAAVGRDIINMLASDDDRETYAHYFVRSYIDCNSKAKWCPAPGCKFAVYLVDESSSSKVTCNCSYSFCWKCTKETHQPISCATVKNWEMGSLVQSGNWTVPNTRSCPNCGQPVEVNDQWKHLECASCKFHFCKLCLASWLNHGFWRGDHFTHVCSEGKLKQPAHLQAALEEIHKLESGQLKELADKQGKTEADMSFVKEAWLQIADCKRILKWACVYEYYLPSYEMQKISLLSYLLRGAEVVLEQLYRCASELTTFISMNEPSADFINFRIRLFSLTGLARNYYDNMVWAIENGSSDLNALRRALHSRKLGVFASASRRDEETGDFDHIGNWRCGRCQFPNDASAFTCVMCLYR